MLTQEWKQGQKQHLLHEDVYYQITSWTYLKIYKVVFDVDLPKHAVLLALIIPCEA